MAGKRLLLLGGTAEARSIALRLEPMADVTTVTSLAGATRNPARYPDLQQSGGFGGIEGLQDYLRGDRITAIIDATHPFAIRISDNASKAAARAGIPIIHLVRPAWTRMPDDTWHSVSSLAEAASFLEQSSWPEKATVFLALGRLRINAFRDVRRFRFLLRSIEAPDPGDLPEFCTTIRASGPDSEESERDLLTNHSVRCIVARNSGGSVGYAKIAAARALCIPVIMVERPASYPGPRTDSMDAILEWVRNLP